VALNPLILASGQAILWYDYIGNYLRRIDSMPKRTKLITAMLLVIIIVISFGAGYILGHTAFSSSPEGLDTIGQAWDIIFTEYIDRSKLASSNLSHAAIEGMVESIDDPYTSFLEAEYYEIGMSSLEGEFDGIGAYVTIQDEKLMIIAPIADSPADKAGIKAGDIILEIDGEPVIDMSLAEAIIKIRGPKGTSVRLLVLHEGGNEPEEIAVIRARVELPSVRFEMEGDIAYINITQFSERTDDELSSVLDDLDENTTKAIILDLRGNPGGLLETVIDVASRFISEGIVVEIMNNQGKVATLTVNTNMPTTDLPMVVLVDKTSASGSEVLAGALQDHNRAIVAGNTTYGKGSVNILRRLDDGSGLYITTARWLTPNGRIIEGQGIEPDIRLELTGEDAIHWAVDYLLGSE
jgi:carboxyl-terminal processing protease